MECEYSSAIFGDNFAVQSENFKFLWLVFVTGHNFQASLLQKRGGSKSDT